MNSICMYVQDVVGGRSRGLDAMGWLMERTPYAAHAGVHALHRAVPLQLPPRRIAQQLGLVCNLIGLQIAHTDRLLPAIDVLPEQQRVPPLPPLHHHLHLRVLAGCLAEPIGAAQEGEHAARRPAPVAVTEGEALALQNEGADPVALLALQQSCCDCHRIAHPRETTNDMSSIPMKLLNESMGHVVTVELNSGQTLRGKLLEMEDTGNCSIAGVTATARDGRVTHLAQVYVRGSSVRLYIVPDMLRNAPMFRRNLVR